MFLLPILDSCSEETSRKTGPSHRVVLHRSFTSQDSDDLINGKDILIEWLNYMSNSKETKVNKSQRPLKINHKNNVRLLMYV